MRSKYKTLLIITALLTLLPMAVGFILWARLPERIVSGMDAQGNVTSTNSREFAVIWMPLIMLVFHLVLTAVGGGKRNSEILTDKVYKGLCLAAPMLCNAVCLPTFAAALGYNIPLNIVICCIVGVMFIVLGIFLPRLKKNASVGLRFPWALRDEDVWVFTHRVAGITFIICGIAFIIAGFFYSTALVICIFAAAVLIPLIVSAIYGSVTEKRKEHEAEIKKAAAKAARIKAGKPKKPAKKLK